MVCGCRVWVGLVGLAGADLTDTTLCLELAASQEFSQVIMVWRMGAGSLEVAFCPGGSCG